MPPPIILTTREGYDRWSGQYDGDGNPLLLLEEPHVARLVGEARGRRILDVGCGTGRHALALAAAGARVTGVDFSAGMLAQLKAKPGAGDVELVEHDLTTRLPFEDGGFDVVLCCLVLDHIAELTGFMGELGRVCRPGGRIVLSVMHPALMLKGIQARFLDPATGEEVRPASVPNQISDYVMSIGRAGLVIDEMSEHLVTEELAARAPRAARHVGWPMLLLFALRPV